MKMILLNYAAVICFLICTSAADTLNKPNQGPSVINNEAGSSNSILGDFLKNLINKMKSPPGLNKYNACVWKICSKPLKNRQKPTEAPKKGMMIKNDDGTYIYVEYDK